MTPLDTYITRRYAETHDEHGKPIHPKYIVAFTVNGQREETLALCPAVAAMRARHRISVILAEQAAAKPAEAFQPEEHDFLAEIIELSEWLDNQSAPRTTPPTGGRAA